MYFPEGLEDILLLLKSSFFLKSQFLKSRFIAFYYYLLFLGKSMEGIIDAPADPAFDMIDICANNEDDEDEIIDETLTAKVKFGHKIPKLNFVSHLKISQENL
jgi:hypothetical protein